jgi:hypothetical protein
MIGRRAVVRRRPLLRTAAVGGMGYMAGRAAAGRANDMAAAQQQQYAQQPMADATTGAPGASAADQLSQLSTLYQQGALTDEEFAAAKAQILSG